jgi:hypothetical protein
MADDYARQAIASLGGSGEPISAHAARGLAVRNKEHNTLNYSLAIRQVYDLIRSAAESGNDVLFFSAPSFVHGGTICDPILLARQIKAKLSAPDLGFKVVRDDNELTIRWENNQ